MNRPGLRDIMFMSLNVRDLHPKDALIFLEYFMLKGNFYAAVNEREVKARIAELQTYLEYLNEENIRLKR